jgi:hypothetical protein
MEDDQYIIAYTKFRSELRKVESIAERMPYRWLNLPNPIPCMGMVYFGMLEDYACELANVINQFVNDIENLCAWEKVLSEYGEEERFYLVYEFIEPLCTMCLNFPYVIRSRFIFSATHLSHQANMALLGKHWKDDLPKDNSINFKTMDKYAVHWKSYEGLKASMEGLSDEKYQTEVNQYRNKYHHRYPCHIECGLSETFKRNINENGRVSYSFGYSNPLQIKDVIPTLKGQHAAAVKCFKCFQDLVQEQMEKILSSSKPLPEN